MDSNKNYHALDSFKEAQSVLEAFINPQTVVNIEKAVDLLHRALSTDRVVLSCGNGGSTCDAMHFAEEFTGRYRKDRKPLKAMAIADPSHITCVANDFGFNDVFSRTVHAFGEDEGVLLAISTSGNSQNILNAIDAARKRNMKVIGLSGKDGGQMIDLCDVFFLVPSQMTDRIQEIHIKVIHALIEGVERKIFPENYS
ncbi:MAG: D-sedoheptulose 7-phosphate isomerase [Candidatus Cloacimonetes bacterium]|nr:D-sedoheptulose 7-phosphate isomerase [Candidatus Cloacimonadota bacterium]